MPKPFPAHMPASTPIVSIIVVSYNTKAMTHDCLQTVVKETRVPYELIVIDNASTDGSAEAIAVAFPAIRLIASRDNHGFAKANNLAASEARGEYLLLLNPDTLILDGAIDRLVAFAGRTPEAGIWGGRTLKRDGSLDPTCCFGDQTLWHLFCRTAGFANLFPRSEFFNGETYGGWQRDSERAVDVIQGCFFLIRRTLWEQLDGFDLTFVMYSEEADLCRRARTAGAQPRMTPEATIIHYGGASSIRRSDREILIMQARVTMARRHLPVWQRGPAVLLLRLWPWTRAVGGRILARLTGHRGAAEAAEHWSRVWEARKRWQAGFPPLA